MLNIVYYEIKSFCEAILDSKLSENDTAFFTRII